MSRMSVLIVDDDAFTRDFMKAKMASWGYETVISPGGVETLEILKNTKVDAVVLDYMMPRMDGMATLEEIRKIDKDVPVIMFTGNADQRSMDNMDRLKISAYIPKSSVCADNQSLLKAALLMIEKKLNKAG
jgi:two-component system, sporulation sensor kinase A